MADTSSNLVDNVVQKLSNANDALSQKFLDSLGTYDSKYGMNRTVFDNKYSVENLTYPEDLFSSRGLYGDNYAIFHINVAEDSKILSDKNPFGGGPADTVEIGDTERLRSSMTQDGITAEGIKMASTVVAGGAAITGTKTAAGALIGAAGVGGVVAAANGKMQRQQKRLRASIALNVPNSLSIRYSTNWAADEDTMAFQSVVNMTEGGMKALNESLSSKSANLGAAAGPLTSAITAAALNVPSVGSALSAASGLTANPKKEQIFKGVDFRSFTFDYQFAPRSKTELRNVMNIINMFKYHMHPEYKDAATFVFVYPSEFDITYYHKQDENTYLHRHTSCVLKDMTINYAPNASFVSFEDGAPTQINVQLTFGELAILTKDQIKAGY